MHMALEPYFKPARSFGVGFDDVIKRLDDMVTASSKALGGYPPYNIIKTDENKYLIEVAVAGFARQDIEIELKENTLHISGKIVSTEDKAPYPIYEYKGIADRSFVRTFNLADTIEIKNAELINGMLKIWLENIIPDHKKPRKIAIEEPTEIEGLIQ